MSQIQHAVSTAAELTGDILSGLDRISLGVRIADEDGIERIFVVNGRRIVETKAIGFGKTELTALIDENNGCAAHITERQQRRRFCGKGIVKRERGETSRRVTLAV